MQSLDSSFTLGGPSFGSSKNGGGGGDFKQQQQQQSQSKASSSSATAAAESKFSGRGMPMAGSKRDSNDFAQVMSF